MRILALVTDAFGGRGGIAKFNRDLLNAFCADPSVEEVVALPRLMPEPPGPLPLRLKYVTGIPAGKLGYFLGALLAVWKNPRFDVILCGHIYLLPLAALARKWAPRSRLILMMHGIEAWQRPHVPFLEECLSRVDAFAAVSEFTKNKFLSWADAADRRWFLLPNSVDLERFHPGPKNEALLERYGLAGKKVLLTVARLSAQEQYKGVDEVLEVLPGLLKESPQAAYLIVGRGTDRRRLEAKAASLDIRDRVVFAGYVSEDEKADHYRLADCFVMPSRGEGFGIVFLEALACGIPVIGSSEDAAGEVLRGGLGILVDPQNPGEIKKAVLQALQNPREDVREKLSFYAFSEFVRRTQQMLAAVLHLKRT